MASPLRSSRLIGLLLIALPALALATPGEWEFRRESDGIRVFTRDSPIPGLKTVRAETVIPVDDPYVIVALLDDAGTAAELMDRVSSVEELESPERAGKHLHLVLDMPWPVRDRDVAAVATIRHDEENRRFILSLTGRQELIPVDPRYLRVPSFDSSYTLNYGREDGVHVILEFTIDPGVRIPAWVMNYGITRMPVKMLANLRRLVSR
jgi:hypothetical protein